MGLTGDTGPMGSQGPQGEMGPSGVMGLRGEKVRRMSFIEFSGVETDISVTVYTLPMFHSLHELINCLSFNR